LQNDKANNEFTEMKISAEDSLKAENDKITKKKNKEVWAT